MTGGSRITYRECSMNEADRLGSLNEQTNQVVGSFYILMGCIFR